CNELQNGGISLNVNGENAGYTYVWNNGMTTENVSNLNTNNYSVIISDINGCDTTLNFSLVYDKQLSLAETISSPTCPNGLDGSISVNATGGNDFNYQWNNGPNTNSWTNIGSGNYQLTATDSDGCKITSLYTV